MSLEYGDMLKDKYVRERFQVYREMLYLYSIFVLDRKYPAVLDLGCYTGNLREIFPPATKYYGVDKDKEALKIADKNGVIASQGNLEKISFGWNKKYDVVLLTEVLEHLKNPRRLLNEVNKLDFGVVLISLPNENTIYHRLKILFGKGIGEPFTNHYHLHFPTIKQSQKFVSNYFKIIDKRYYIHLGSGITEKILSKIPIWNLLARWFPSLFARGVVLLCARK